MRRGRTRNDQPPTPSRRGHQTVAGKEKKGRTSGVLGEDREGNVRNTI